MPGDHCRRKNSDHLNIDGYRGCFQTAPENIFLPPIFLLLPAVSPCRKACQKSRCLQLCTLVYFCLMLIISHTLSSDNQSTANRTTKSAKTTAKTLNTLITRAYNAKTVLKIAFCLRFIEQSSVLLLWRLFNAENLVPLN